VKNWDARPDFSPDAVRRGPGCIVSFLTAVVTVFILIVLVGAGGWFVIDGPGPLPKTATVELRKGAGVSEMAASLRRANVVGSAAVFKLAAELSGADRKLKAGEYQFPAHVTISEVIRKMAAGEVLRHFVTIPEGKTSAQAVAILMANPVLAGTVTAPPEGSLLPETYEVTRGESRADLIAKMRAARDSLLADLWAARQQDLPFKSPEEAVILASVVEKETGLANERPLVAAVFVNRLKKGMKLESDPTIVYGITRGEPLGHGIRLSEKNGATPYNTYVIAGLPPTPICNPGRAALAAVLNPEHTDALFFVANGNGGSSFASTQAEHNKNVAAWRQVEAERKAKAQAAAAPPVKASAGPFVPPAAVPAPHR
jgi:UPF0755 protein